MSGGAICGLFLQGPYPQGEFLRPASTILFRDRSPGWDRYIASFTTGEDALTVRPFLFFENGRGRAWFDDVFLVRSSDQAESVNLLQNPGFETTVIPFWPEHWWTWAQLPGYVGSQNALWAVDETVAYEGKRSLRMSQREWTDTTYPQTALDVQQANLRLEANQPYTVSAFLRADRPGTRVWLWINYKLSKELVLDTGWQRHSFTCASPAATTQGFVRVSMRSAGTVWVDAVQLERGSTPLSYTEPE
jgi:hypothetical protein